MALSSRQRVLRVLKRQPADCVAVGPFMYDLAAVAAGVALREFYTSAETMARAQLVLHEQVDQDIIAIGSDNFYIAEGFGCRTTRQEDELPSLVTPAASSLDDVFDLAVPDPSVQGRMPVMLEAIRQVRKQVGDEVAIRAPGTGPFALASYLVGSQKWLCEIGMVETGQSDGDEAAIHHALGLATEALIRFGKACWEAGADLLQCGDSLASCNVISPRTYRRFAQPYQRRVLAAWKEYGVDASLLHICGDSTSVLEEYVATGADLVEIDHHVDLGFAKRRIGGQVVLVGNVHTVADLLNGTPERVRFASLECIRKAGSGGGLILGSGCLVPRRTPLENVQEMVRTARSQPYPSARTL